MVTKRQMNDILAACQRCTDDALSERAEESVDWDNCSQLRASDLSGGEDMLLYGVYIESQFVPVMYCHYTRVTNLSI